MTPPSAAGEAPSAARRDLHPDTVLAAERLADLQRLQAEYVNYKRRVDRDRAVVQERAAQSVIEALLPVLDDIHAAREHGDLAGGPFAAIADKLESTLGKFGLERYGAAGEAVRPEPARGAHAHRAGRRTAPSSRPTRPPSCRCCSPATAPASRSCVRRGSPWRILSDDSSIQRRVRRVTRQRPARRREEGADMASQDWFEKDFYAILGVPKDADAAAIKKAYRKLARQHHPDQNPGDAAAEQRFKDVGEANSVLSDPEKRREYDAVRPDGARRRPLHRGRPRRRRRRLRGRLLLDVRRRRRPAAVAPASATPPAAAGSPTSRTSSAGCSAEAPARHTGARVSGRPQGPRKGADLTARTSLSFRDAVEGSTVTLGTTGGGQITTRIPAGVKDGQKIRLRGKGQPGDRGAPAGDLDPHGRASSKHPVFGRDGDNLTDRPPGDLRRGRPGRHGRGADPRRVHRQGARRRRAPRAAGCCGQGPRRAASRTSPAT